MDSLIVSLGTSRDRGGIRNYMPYKLCTVTQQQQSPLVDQARPIAVILDTNEQFKAGTGRERSS